MKLEVQNLSLQYNNKPPLFQNISFNMDPGDFVIIKGPSGCGKSSLLRLLNRLQEPTQGTILIDNTPINQHDIPPLRRRIGYIQQTPVVLDDTVRNNLLLPFTFKTARNYKKPTDDILKSKLEAFLLSNIELNDLATTLSIGQKQRLSLIRTLLTEPDIILCDEPTSALDTESRTIVERELEYASHESNVSIILVTHIDFTTQKVTPTTYTLTANGLS